MFFRVHVGEWKGDAEGGEGREGLVLGRAMVKALVLRLDAIFHFLHFYV